MRILLLIIISLLIACKEDHKTSKFTNTEERPVEAGVQQHSKSLEVYNYSDFENFISKSDDKIHVVNFWATWCGPCVKELPHFELLNENYKKSHVEVLLVSIDFPHLYEKKLKPFILEMGLKSKVIALDISYEKDWIKKIDSTWSGTIPATLIYNKSKRQFFERAFTYQELETEVKRFKIN